MRSDTIQLHAVHKLENPNLSVVAEGRFHACCEDSKWHYNRNVARGWESKSVEAQQAEATDRTSKKRQKMSAEDAAQLREKEGLRLARQRVLQQLEVSQNPRHREMLQGSLAELEEKLRRLG